MGIVVGPAGDRIAFTVQANADDVIFISKEPDGVRNMLDILRHLSIGHAWK
jgi:hypothetical protein